MMLKITLIATGKLKERYWREAMDEYLKRLRPYATVSVKEVSDAPDGLGGDSARQREGEAILKALPADAHVVLLDSRGTHRTSEDIAQRFDQLMVQGSSHIAFIIGGSQGASAKVRTVAHEVLSLGDITLPHNLARVVLIEQIYRAFKIIRKEPYHK